MKTSIQRNPNRFAKYRGQVLIGGIVAVCALLAYTPVGKSASWKSKDWTQWTLQECQEILSNSPWAETYALNPTVTNEGPGRQGLEYKSAVAAVISSSLVIRQAGLRQLQLMEDKFPVTPERKQKLKDSFVKQIASCLGERFDDQIVVSIYDADADDFNTGPELVISGRKYLPVSVSQGNRFASPCPQNMTIPSGRANVFAYPRVVNGTPLIGPDETKFVIKTPKGWQRDFEFNAKNMVYQGKRDF
jgi:hypothetical protein